MFKTYIYCSQCMVVKYPHFSQKMIFIRAQNVETQSSTFDLSKEHPMSKAMDNVDE